MAGSGEARGRRQIGRLVRAWAAAAAILFVLGAGAAQAASAGVAATARHAPFVGAGRVMHPDAFGQECFFTFPACTSADPAVTFVMETGSDSTGCVFGQDTSWGDHSADTVVTYMGGKPSTPLTTFAHTYAAPGTFQISYTISVKANPHNACSGGSGSLQFTLAAPPPLACQSSPVTVPATTAALPPSGRGIGIGYGSLPLTFTPGVTGTGARCTMRPVTGSLPVDLRVPGAATPISLGQADMTATVSFFAASSVATTIPPCDFGPLQALTDPSVTPPLADFAHTNDCFLTPTYHAKWDVVARWTVPGGIVQTVPSHVTNSGTTIYATQPLTYYVDLDTLPLPQDFSGDTMSALVDFIYSTITQNLPVPDRIALIQNPSAHLLVSNPRGRLVGRDSKKHTHAFAGSGYAEIGGRPIAWILEPMFGAYHVSVRGKSGSKFSVDLADLQFLGHGNAPLVENFAWNGTLSSTGTASRQFHVHGTALSPVLTPDESRTRVRPQTRVHFTLANSVVPLGITKVLWRFGDGTRARGKLAAHRYRKTGRFTPAVTVTDAAGYKATVKLRVIIVKR